MKRGIQGSYQTLSYPGEAVRAYIPNPLPPSPDIQWSEDLRIKFDHALLALGRLDSLSDFLPDQKTFLDMYIRKEAVLSSMIEGTQSSLSDLLLYEVTENPDASSGDVEEVSRCVKALEHGMTRMREGFPLSLRLIKEIHKILLSHGRGAEKLPGEFRMTQNWIGGSRPGNASFVPPPPADLMNHLSALEHFIHDNPVRTSTLTKAAMIHVQFETIHPFLDGNGRLGRLLITLILCSENVLREPLLYLSLYLKNHRQTYYDLLNRVRLEGDWEIWLDFFAEAVFSTATEATLTARELFKITNEDRQKIAGFGRLSSSIEKVFEALIQRPVTTTNWIVKSTCLTHATVGKCLQKLKGEGIVSTLSEAKRNRVFCYKKYFETLDRSIEHPI